MPMRVMMAFIPYSIYIFALSLIPIPPEAVENVDVSNIESIFLARLIVFGTFVMGLLSGLGAARNIWEYLPIPFGSKKRCDPLLLSFFHRPIVGTKSSVHVLFYLTNKGMYLRNKKLLRQRKLSNELEMISKQEGEKNYVYKKHLLVSPPLSLFPGT